MDDDRQTRQNGMHRALQDTVPLAVNDPHLEDTTLRAQGKIIGDQTFAIPRCKSVKVEAAINRQFDHFGNLFVARNHTLCFAKSCVLLTLIIAGATTPPETIIFIASSTPKGAGKTFAAAT